jgi:hypothetical protein
MLGFKHFKNLKMEGMIKEKLALALISFYLGMQALFSFLIAPILFSTVERSQAAMVVEKFFPFYFAIGIVAVGVSLFLLWWKNKVSKFILSMLGLTFLLLVVQEAFIYPYALELKTHNMGMFKKLHSLSMVFNFIEMLLLLASAVYLILKGEKQNSKEQTY